MTRFAVLLLLPAVVACGSSPSASSPTVTAQGGTNNNAANIAAKAAEPRTGDPTGARPLTNSESPPPPAPSSSKFGNVGMTGAPPEPEPAPATTSTDPQASAPMKARPSRIGARHVLIQWMGAEKANNSVVRSKEQAFNLAKDVHRRAKAKEDFARLAVEYSDEPNAGQRGGSLGRFGRGQMVAAFDEAAFKLEVGEISEIVESPFGFHVIQRTE